MGGRGGKKKLTTVLYDVKTSGKHILYRQYPKTDDVIDFHVHVTSVIVLHIYSKKKKKFVLFFSFFFSPVKWHYSILASTLISYAVCRNRYENIRKKFYRFRLKLYGVHGLNNMVKIELFIIGKTVPEISCFSRFPS